MTSTDWTKPITDAGEPDPEFYPQLGNVSAGMLMRYIPVPNKPTLPEIVRIPLSQLRERDGLSLDAICALWGMAWESGPARGVMFREELPKGLKFLADITDRNLYLVPAFGRKTYPEYLPIFHLIRACEVVREGIRPRARGVWPIGHFRQDAKTSTAEYERVARAFARQVWPFLYPRPRSGVTAFSSSDSLRLLAHNLDFWVPYVHAAIETRMREGMPRIKLDDDVKAVVEEMRVQASVDGYSVEAPRMGGTIWMGDQDALDVTQAVVEHADRDGQIRGILDALESNRVQDDFSDRWSFAKEDFERKLYRKRSRSKVTFIELSDTIPVHAAEAESHDDNLFFQDFLSLVDRKTRQVLVMLRSGHTQAEIARQLGYRNHSPVSKALARARKQAALLLDE